MTIVKTILKQLPVVRQPQAKFFAILFATILALRGHVNPERGLASSTVALINVTPRYALYTKHAYVATVQIEFLLRDAKQFTGLTDCQMREERALGFHFNASLATLNLVRVTEVQAAAGAPLKVFLMASWKQRNFNERLVATIIDRLELEPPGINNLPRYEEIRAYGAIAA